MVSPRLSCVVAVVDKADAIMDGVHDGFCCLMSAATPATCGVAMLVPEIRANSGKRPVYPYCILGKNELMSKNSTTQRRA
nr:GDP-fucose protein O-fucosyltransferase [Ipomoea trifida]